MPEVFSEVMSKVNVQGSYEMCQGRTMEAVHSL